MGEKINDDQVADLLDLLRSNASLDAKVASITLAKSAIKQNNVPDSCVSGLFEICRTAMTSQQAVLVNAGFTTLNHLLTRLSRQDPKYLAKEAVRTLPCIVEKVGDPKEKYRQLAAMCLTTFWKAAPQDVERAVKNTGMTGKNSRAKETCMQWLVQTHQENGLQFKGFVPVLMELLEDADGMVRDCARNAVIDLFENAPNAAKSDLKKQLKTFGVRPTIVEAIVSHLNQGPASDLDGAAPDVEPQVSSLSHSMNNGVAHATSARPVTPVMDPKIESVDPSYVNTQRELDDTFRDMHPFFEGKESEQNWLKREQSCTKLRRLNAGNAPADFHDAWLMNIKGLLDGILKAVNSLRTSLSKEGCHVVQEVTRTAGSGIDPMVEILLQNLIKLCGGTKKIASQAGDTTVDIIMGRASYSIRILQHIWLAVQDKNVQPRTYAAGWLRTLLRKEAHHKAHLEHSGGLDLIEKCIKKGLADANPSVREKMRGTYWSFAQIWPAKAELIHGALDATQQRLLDNDSNNPNSPKKAAPIAVRPGLGFSKSTNAPPKPSLRETMLAKKKDAMAQKNLPARPGSAMSSFSPIRSVSNSSVSSTVSSSSEFTRPRSRAEGTTVAHGGLSVAPMRPTKLKSRPELPRPATAGPYSVRRPTHAASASAESNTISPTASRPQMTAFPSSNVSPRKNVQRPDTSHSSHGSQASSANSPLREKLSSSRLPVSPQSSPQSKVIKSNSSSPSKADEDLTMVMPTFRAMDVVHGQSRDMRAQKSSPATHFSPVRSLKVFEDPFSSNDDQTTPQPALTMPVLEEVAINEDIPNLMRTNQVDDMPLKAASLSPEHSKHNLRLVDSATSRIRAKTLDLHGFRKLQTLIKDDKVAWTNDKLSTLISVLFGYLQADLSSFSPERTQDIKIQVISTIKLLHQREPEAFRLHVLEGLQSLILTRKDYDARAHIVGGLELLASDLAALAEPQEAINLITDLLEIDNTSTKGCRMTMMSIHVLKEILETNMTYAPADEGLDGLGKLASQCLESSDSGVRQDAMQLCVTLHARVGEEDFWKAVGSVKDANMKNLVTYYIVKKQKEMALA